MEIAFWLLHDFATATAMSSQNARSSSPAPILSPVKVPSLYPFHYIVKVLESRLGLAGKPLSSWPKLLLLLDKFSWKILWKSVEPFCFLFSNVSSPESGSRVRNRTFFPPLRGFAEQRLSFEAVLWLFLTNHVKLLCISKLYSYPKMSKRRSSP